MISKTCSSYMYMPMTARLDLGCLGFSSMRDDLVAVADRDAVLAGVLDLLEEYLGAALAACVKACGRRADVALDDVVAEHDDDLVAVGVLPGEAQGVGDAAHALLVGVGEPLEADSRARCRGG